VSLRWDADRLEILRRLWARGLAAPEIAAQLGTTKFAVYQRAYRLGLAARPRLRRHTTAPHVLPSPPAPVPLPPPEPVHTHGASPLLAVCAGECLWPHGDPRAADFGFCRRPVAAAGVPYCHDHVRRAYLPASSGRKV
jgi:GcrA cell cycle regulator